MRFIRLLFLLPAGLCLAAPLTMLVVAPGSATSVYWQSDDWWLAPSSGAAPLCRLDLDPDQPVYLLLEQQPGALDAVRRTLRPLYDGHGAMLIQAPAGTAERLSGPGVALVRIPDEPHPVYEFDGTGYPRAVFLDTFIERLVSRVSADSIRRQIQRLQDFRTRYSPADSCRSAETYIRDYFVGLGLDSAALFAYEYMGDTWRNPVGIIRGRANPDRIVVVCGHMDCTSEDPWNDAPGAEDNASGTVMAMEAARVLADIRPDFTLQFIGFSGEEQGLIGSMFYAAALRAAGADVVAALNFDMIAYPGGEFGVAIFCNQASVGLAEFEDMMAEQYTALDHVYLVGMYGSDQLSFHQYGYRATAGGEYGGSYPWYHTTGDLIGNLSMDLAAEVAKMAVASAALLAVTPAPPDSFVLLDLGTGGTLYAAWAGSAEPDLAGYKLLWGTSRRNYTDSVLLGRVVSHHITGLTNGTRYYATVAAFDSTGHESGFSTEQSAVPSLIPLPPDAPVAMPGNFSMDICWRPNQEMDFAGYNIYRSTRSRTGYVRLNPGLLADTAYSDTGLLSDTMYYYVATAVDTQGHESDSSAEVRGKPITLDHGILLVDETRDGTGQPGSPSDQQQDAFYHEIVHGFSYTDWDAAQQGVPTAGDIGPYSTVVWHADEFQQQQLAEVVPGIENYLAHGGRLWLVGWKPIAGIMGSGRYPYNFSPGQFPYDALHLRRAEQSLISDFTGATGASGYPDVAVDSTKLLPAMRGRLPFIDALLPRDAEAVLTFNSYSGDTFAGKPVGVRWLGGQHRAVCFGFPLYYCYNAQARQLAIRVLTDLGEPYGVGEQPAGPHLRSELTVIPNPVAGSALVNYSVPAAGPLRLSLYDAAGRRVRVLAAGSGQAGSWSVRLDSRGLRAGVYFCRLEAGAERKTARVEIVD